jgi:uncharacterized repeat protein (TIGR01451 family)
MNFGFPRRLALTLVRAFAGCLLLFAALPAQAQPVLDLQSAGASAAIVTATPTMNYAYTSPAGINQVLFVSVHMNISASTATTVGSVTYGGLPLTLGLSVVDTGGPNTRTELWFRASPVAGAGTVVVTLAGMAAARTVPTVSAASTFSNVDLTTVASATNVAFGNNNNATNTVASAANELVVDWVTARTATTATVSGGQNTTGMYNVVTAFGTNDLRARSGREIGAASSTISWTLGAAVRWTDIIVSLTPARADVAVTETATPDALPVGGTITYTFTVTNNGPNSATGVSFTDTIPAGTTFVSAVTSVGSCSGTTTQTCTLGTMANAASATITITVTAPATGGGITNTGTVTTTPSVDPTAGNNSASATVYPFTQLCATPGRDGAGGVLAGAAVNSYRAGSASAAAGATSIPLAAGTAWAAGDLLLVIQMQDAAIDFTNDDRYGAGTGAGGTTNAGSGYSAINSAGRYEYVVVGVGGVGAGAASVPITGTGAGGGLLFSYTNAAAAAGMGQRRYQVIKIPQYATATLGNTLTAPAWNGTIGGVLAIDVAGDLTPGGATVNLNGKGFRGGGTLARTGAGGGTILDYVATDATAMHGTKAEGIAGTPRYLVNPGVGVTTLAAQGYPNGDFGRGAPGTAGGGGTDTGLTDNGRNSGGGGGGNGGTGGKGGNTWETNDPTGGFGGINFPATAARVALGGGGGSGSRNNDPGNDQASGGANGGGIVLIRAGNIPVGTTATITANGSAAYNLTLNDGGGGGGAGGTILVLSRNGGVGQLTLNANGGRGADAWNTQAIGAAPTEQHGPGGGGAGGVLLTSSAPAVASTVTGGIHGQTTTSLTTYGSSDGTGGIQVTITESQIPGSRPGSGCAIDLTAATAAVTDPLTAGNNETWNSSITNNSLYTAAPNPTFTQSIPAGWTYVSATPPGGGGWSCSATAVLVTCTTATPLAPGATANFVVVMTSDPAATNGSTVTSTATASTSGSEPITTNNSASDTVTMQRRVDIGMTKVDNLQSNNGVPAVAYYQGDPITYTITATNNGPSRASNVTVTDVIPTGMSYTSSSAPCTYNAGTKTVTCTYATVDVGAANKKTITISGTVTSAPGTAFVNTASSTRTEIDTAAANDSASYQSNVAFNTAVTIMTMDASQDTKGRVTLSWRTSYEKDNLGFNIYRSAGKAQEKINKRLILGSALSGQRSLKAGYDYGYKDSVKSGSFVQYYIEDIDLHGTKTMHGPITPTMIGQIADTPLTDTPADLGSVGGIFVTPAGMGTPGPYPISGDLYDPGDLTDENNPTATSAQIKQQYALAADASIKFLVTEEGWYSVKRSDMVAAGFDPGSVSSALALFADGNEVPLLINDGGDGNFGSGDSVQFYGTGNDTPSTGARAYWLVTLKGKQLRVKDAATAKGKGIQAAPANFPYTFSRTERTIYFTALTNNGEKENFFGAVILSDPATQDVTVNHLDPAGGDAALEIAVQGATDGVHSVAVGINNHDLGTLSFFSQGRTSQTLPVPAAWLAEGSNTLSVRALGGDADVSVVESLHLTYPHALIADNDALKLAAPGSRSVSVAGFSSIQVRVFDVTDPSGVSQITPTVTKVGSTWTASFVTPSGAGTHTILAVGNARVAAPAAIVPSRPSAWNDKHNRADLLVLTTRTLAPTVAPLKALRDSQGISTQVIDVQDLYDEFGFGARGPDPIRDFLRKTRDWQTAPRWVLLVGDASFDPRNYLGMGAYDFVPTKIVATREMKTASDEWLVDFTGDNIGELAIGRLPARTTGDATLMINKIANRAIGSDPWTKSVLLISDSNIGFDFEAATNALTPLIPSGLTATKIFASQTPDAHGTVLNALNTGALLVNYVGHGSQEVWNSGMMQENDPASLTNGSKLPVYVIMDCLNGLFHDLYSEAVAERLLKNPNGGAVGVWASSGLTEADGQALMDKELFRQLSTNPTISFGEAILKAKKATTVDDVRKTWIFFGDPSMKMQ